MTSRFGLAAGSGGRLAPLVALLLLTSCARTTLYLRGDGDPPPDRVGLTGEVCTTDARTAGFPVRVLFLVDVAAGPLFATYDPARLRIAALTEAAGLHAGSEDFAFSILGLGPYAEPLSGAEFTRDPSVIATALADAGVPRTCVDDRCRDYTDGLDLARSVIEGELADVTAGQRSRTQYVIVLATGGPPAPLSNTWDETTAELVEQASRIRRDIEAQGALSVMMHTMYLASEDGTPDFVNTSATLQQMSFVGGGRYEQFPVSDGIGLDRFGLLKLEALLEPKTVMVTNRTVLPAPGGGTRDSDGDGLADIDEPFFATDVDRRDSDFDDLGDLVEVLVSLNPLEFTDPPRACLELLGPPYGDIDGDGLNDCEELLVGTVPTLADSDGDSIIDWIEVINRTNYLRADLLDDDDWDGANNGQELLQHTDPGTSDASEHLSDAYRYEVTDAGLVVGARVAQPREILGVEVLAGSDLSTAGVGTLTWVAEPPTLSWRDPIDDLPGIQVPIDGDGAYTLTSSSPDLWLDIEVEASRLPPSDRAEPVLVERTERSCRAWTVRNIALVEGVNDLDVYFSEAPTGRLDQPGSFRRAQLQVSYDPLTGRSPDVPLITVLDQDFLPLEEP